MVGAKKKADRISLERSISGQFFHVEGTTVGQLPFGLCPDSFVRIQLGRIGWEVLDWTGGMVSAKLRDGLAFMSRGVVQQYDEGSGQVPQ